MTERKASIHTLPATGAETGPQPIVGRIDHVDESGRAHVVFEGSHGVAVPARSTVAEPWRAGEGPEDMEGAPVLLVLEGGDPMRPIVIGLVHDRFRPPRVRPEATLGLGEERDVIVDGHRVVFDAREEVVLRCGRGSIVMRRDGKVVVRGTNLISRSSGANKIKGASIDLN
jgi:hypothetical protein